ncbi:MAG: HlyC/CorC family transporter [Phycisphaerales bacterium]|nr:HlyC/CorC family transporter [Phycisphaerales bacterium]
MGLWIIILLIVLNGAFVLIEMALVSSRRARLESRAGRGDRGARLAIRLLDSPNLYLSTVQIGITACGVLLGAFGEEALAERLAAWLAAVHPPLAPYTLPIAFAMTVAALTFVIIVVAELVPKRIAQMAPEAWARAGSRPMWIMSRICRPLVWLLSVSTNLVLALVPIKSRAGSDHEVESEVKAIIASGARTGVFHHTEQQIVERVFKLSDQSVKAVMVPRTEIEFLLIDESPERIRALLATSGHSHFPVCRSGLDELVGVVHVKDLVKQTLVREEIRLAEIVKPPLFVPESTPAIEMVEIFRTQRTHIAFVLDEYGVLEGLVTLYDVVEGLVGEVQRQGDIDEPWVVKRQDGSYLLDGRLSVGEVRDLINVEKLPKEDLAGYETLGGLVMTNLGRIPATGDRFQWREFTFEVMDMDKARVDKVLLTAARTPHPSI